MSSRPLPPLPAFLAPRYASATWKDATPAAAAALSRALSRTRAGSVVVLGWSSRQPELRSGRSRPRQPALLAAARDRCALRRFFLLFLLFIVSLFTLSCVFCGTGARCALFSCYFCCLLFPCSRCLVSFWSNEFLGLAVVGAISM